jgi:hypothetical protein
VISWFQSLLFQIQLVPLHRGGGGELLGGGSSYFLPPSASPSGYSLPRLPSAAFNPRKSGSHPAPLPGGGGGNVDGYEGVITILPGEGAAVAGAVSPRGGGMGGGGEVIINRSTYQVEPLYLSSETVLPIK